MATADEKRELFSSTMMISTNPILWLDALVAVTGSSSYRRGTSFHFEFLPLPIPYYGDDNVLTAGTPVATLLHHHGTRNDD